MEEKNLKYEIIKKVVKLVVIIIFLMIVVLPVMDYIFLKDNSDRWKDVKDQFKANENEIYLEENEQNFSDSFTTNPFLQSTNLEDEMQIGNNSEGVLQINSNNVGGQSGTLLENNGQNAGNQESTNVLGIRENTLSTGYCYGESLDTRLNTIVEIDEETIQEYLEKAFGENKEEQKKYLKSFFKAEYATLFPDLRTKDKIGTIFEENELQGAIQIKRATTDGETASAEASEILEYKPYREFKEMMNAKNRDVLNYFTLDVEKTTNDDGEESSIIKLIVASMNEVVTDKETNDELVLQKWQSEGYQFSEGSPDNDTKTAQKIETSFSEVSIAYQELVRPYSMPSQLLWTLLTLSKDKEFTEQLTNLIIGDDGTGNLKTKIIITVQDNITTTISVEEEEYSRDIKNNGEVGLEGTIDGISEKPTEEKTFTSEDVQDGLFFKTTVTTAVNSTYIDVTYADTWVIKYENSYNNKKETLAEVYNQENLLEDEEEYKLMYTTIMRKTTGFTRRYASTR